MTTTEATSSTVPKRPIGITLEVARGFARIMSVSTSAGQTVFAVMPYLASNAAYE